jgi:hypothetical protein
MESQTLPLPTEYDNEVKALANKAANELVSKDVNTVLRETQAKADAAIAEQLKKMKKSIGQQGRGYYAESCIDRSGAQRDVRLWFLCAEEAG